MHMSTPVRMHLRMAIRLLHGLRFRARCDCFAVLGIPACGTMDLNFGKRTYALLFSHRARPPFCSAAVCAKHTE